MRKGFQLAGAFAVLALWPAIATAEQGEALCPAEIETEQSLRTPVTSYEAHDTKARHFWAAITFYEGRPEEMVSLHYDTEVEKPDHGAVLTWSLDRETEYWIECLYSSTAISLLKKLGTCEVSYNLDVTVQAACH
jgi:hypothetical protein